MHFGGYARLNPQVMNPYEGYVTNFGLNAIPAPINQEHTGILASAAEAVCQAMLRRYIAVCDAAEYEHLQEVRINIM